MHRLAIGRKWPETMSGAPQITMKLRQYVRLTKSRKVSAKNCVQIVANMVREFDHDFAIAGYALLPDAPLLSVSPGHRGWIPYWSPLAAALSQPRSNLVRFLGPQTHQRSALSLAVKPSAQPPSHLERLWEPEKQQRRELSVAVKSPVRRVVL
jgi:hypothetical protein